VQFTLVSAVGAALAKIVREPGPATHWADFIVTSFVATVHCTTLVLDTNEFVTTKDLAPTEKFTLPLVLLIVWPPVVPAGVMVLVSEMFHQNTVPMPSPSIVT
jgi:hypothetical protein